MLQELLHAVGKDEEQSLRGWDEPGCAVDGWMVGSHTCMDASGIVGTRVPLHVTSTSMDGAHLGSTRPHLHSSAPTADLKRPQQRLGPWGLQLQSQSQSQAQMLSSLT